MEIFQRLNTLDPAAVGAEDLTPEELPPPALSLSLLMLTRKKRSGYKSSVQENGVN